MKWRKWIITFVVSVTVSNSLWAEDKWVADEIFLQLSEMRKAIQQLQQQMAALQASQGGREAFSQPIPLAGSEPMTLGKPDAQIVIVEFSDYQCPFCAKHYKNVLPKLKERFIDKGIAKYVLKDFPLEFHAYAKKASLAGRCAGEQGHYWAMHNAVFDNRGEASDQLIGDLAKANKLNLPKLQKCLDDPRKLAEIQKDVALGHQLGVRGTPAFFVGKVKDNFVVDYKKLEGVQSFETFAGLIDSLNKN